DDAEVADGCRVGSGGLEGRDCSGAQRVPYSVVVGNVLLSHAKCRIVHVFVRCRSVCGSVCPVVTSRFPDARGCWYYRALACVWRKPHESPGAPSLAPPAPPNTPNEGTDKRGKHQVADQ